MIRAVRSSKLVSSISARPSPMMIPPRNWLAAVFGIDDAAAVIRAEHTVDARLTGGRVDADLAEDRAERVHRVRLHLLRVRRGGLDRHLVAARSSQDLGVALPAAGVGQLAQSLVASADLVGGQPGQRRFVAGECEQLLDERSLRRRSPRRRSMPSATSRRRAGCRGTRNRRRRWSPAPAAGRAGRR